MGYSVVRPAEREYQPIDRGDRGRSIVRLSDALRASRANIWRLPPGAGNARHLERAQEELFVVLEGEATLLLGEPPERVVLPSGSIAVVETGTPLKLRNESSDAAVVLVVGAPPETGKAEYLPEIE
ncbi:MAG: cupin domain-containing protein [Gaiellaceae bacterium]